MGIFSHRLISILAWAIPASYFTIACIAFWNSFLRTSRCTSLFWMLSEGFVIVLLVFHRPSSAVTQCPWDWNVEQNPYTNGRATQ